MKLLDRELQKVLLRKLADAYPGSLDPRDLGYETRDDPAMLFNMAYLSEHGLVIARIDGQFVGEQHMVGAVCTRKGIDFLADDGGLSAVLGVVTIKIHDDTIKQLLSAKIAASDLAPDAKSEMLDQLRQLPAEATKHLALELLGKALDSSPAAIAWLGKCLAQWAQL